MPYIKIWIHLIFSTKNRAKIISQGLKPKLLHHIKENARKKNIFIKCINCIEDHVHIIISLSSDQCISVVSKLIKGESSHWVNLNKLIPGKFEWQDDYIAISVSESILDKVIEYVNNQEEHHRVKSFSEEFHNIMIKYGFEQSNPDLG